MELNLNQKTAAEHATGHALVLAGPGTGKTATLIGRYRYLLSAGTEPEKILCCTFSRKASDELKSKIAQTTKIPVKALPVGTFHALSLRILRALGEQVGIKRNFDIWAKEWERLDIVKDFQNQLADKGIYKDVDPDDITPALALEFIDDSREALLDPEDASIKASEVGLIANIAHAEVYRLYEEHLNSNNLIDFPRMVQWACKALMQDVKNGGHFGKQFTHILVDEYQDINFAQKSLIDSLVSSGGLLWAVGDDLQAIYGWRGSDVRYLLNFEKNYPGAHVYTLSTNYRSGQSIIERANSLSGTLKQKIKKELFSARSENGTTAWEHLSDEKSEALAIADEIKIRVETGIPYSEIAILARTNKLPTSAVHKLIQRGIPVDLKGGVAVFSEYETRLLLTALAISSEQKLQSPYALRLTPKLYGFASKLVGEEWNRCVKALTTYIINRPPIGLSDEQLETRTEILEKHRDYVVGFDNAASLFKFLKSALNPADDSNRVFVGTIHSAKGLEWDSVFVIGMEDGVLPQRQSSSARVLEEEKRVAYVAITRAKNFLFLTSVGERRKRTNDISPFIEDMGLLEVEEETETSQPFVEPRKVMEKQKKEFLDRYSSRLMSPNDRREWVNQLRENRLAAEREKSDTAAQKIQLNNRVADGDGGNGTGWSDQAAGTGLLAEAGYTVRKDGPSTRRRQAILDGVLQGDIGLPDWMTETVQEQWGGANTLERLTKIRNTINVALGNQKGRTNPSDQAIRKWEVDLSYLDDVLQPKIEADVGKD
jgi:DNA helicase II / ATP-dependent DNA helicase PcrA